MSSEPQNSGEHKTHHDVYGNRFEEFYINGKLEGERKIYNSNDQLWRHEFYRNGQLEGEYKSWHENGRPDTREFYRNGQLEGKMEEWYINGNIRMYAFYREGKREGISKKWHDTGGLLEKESYLNGEREGARKVWSTDGLLYASMIYRDGKAKIEYRYYQNAYNDELEKVLYDQAKMTYNFSFRKWYNILGSRSKLRLRDFTKFEILNSYLIADLVEFLTRIV